MTDANTADHPKMLGDGASGPVDGDKVFRIRQAIKAGTYRVDAAEIADRLIDQGVVGSLNRL